MSAFADWFERQHGQRKRSGPDGSVVNFSDADLRMAISLGAAAADELRRRELWDERRTSALYAWNVGAKQTA